ncbi:hypothetical protein CYLTODRAFT_379685 [Cylindrobasidium torrendii FP15055 ss-10]|uniref:Uncharacterized protein n=1 Tax=Cylindrobasidium torrendii FP15055 ss-10 TaxID=1314674 RepID=A0A0D7B700_9AGAR|nr:hypothetical protein CYLTODRAFT_379685 [Cylindrobasidium torrendii FP15055 ss-10]
MYHQRSLATPPPASQFRRPWSPEPFDPNPPTESYEPRYARPQYDNYDYDDDYPRYPRQTRRDPSDASVEALDLADYAATLRRNPMLDYPPPVSQYSSDQPSHAPRSQRRQSMPPASDAGIDVSAFPPWSRHWYDSPSRPSNDPDDLYTLPPQRTTNRGYFDPTYGSASPPFGGTAMSPPPFSPPPPFSSAGHDTLLPWSLDPNDSVDAGTKEERIRMLEREFAGVKPSTVAEGKPQSLIGTTDANGNLVTAGPRKRTVFRILQLLLVLAAAVPGIYAALAIKTTDKPTPAGTPAAYLLYVASCITFLGLFFYFAVRPCFRKRPKGDQNMGIPGLTGMVLPNGNGGKKKKKGKKGFPQQQDVHVNLIVDPSMFRNGGRDEEEEEDWEGSTAIGSNTSSNKRRGPKRKSIMASLMDERMWLAARARAKKVLCLDIFLAIAWLAIFIYMMLGGTCKAPTSASATNKTKRTAAKLLSRAFVDLVYRATSGDKTNDGVTSWCTCWNLSSASACLVSVVSAVCAFFGVKDLGASKVNPRQR